MNDDCLSCNAYNSNWLNCNTVPEATACVDNTRYVLNGDCSLCTTIDVGGTTGVVLTCNSSTVHVTCANTHYLNNDNVCTLCTAANPVMLTCQNSTHALSCSAGNYVLNNTCTACSNIHASCTACTDTPASACTTCDSGFYVHSNTCAACSANCTACTNATYCNTCASNYLLINRQCVICSHINGMWQSCSTSGIVAGTCWPGSYFNVA